MRRRYCMFILSYARPEFCRKKTYSLIRKLNFSSPLYVVVSDDDPKIAEYEKIFGHELVVYERKKYLQQSDTLDNFLSPTSIVLPARNFCFDFAAAHNYDYFIQFDDDYRNICYYYLLPNARVKEVSLTHVVHTRPNAFNAICDYMFDFLDATPYCAAVCFSQSGDYVGGGDLKKKDLLTKNRYFREKAMNTFFIRTNSSWRFLGRINEDVNAYVHYGKTGLKFYTYMPIFIYQTPTTTQEGGLTDAYLALGKYVKSFYTLLLNPSCVKIDVVSRNYNFFPRYHHRIEREHMSPKVVFQNENT